MKNGINKISAYGDSILKGAVTGTDSGHLFDIIEDSSLVLASKALGFELNNQSVFGSIVSKTQRRLNRDIEKGIFSDLAIIESGGNDCDYDWTQVSSFPDEKQMVYPGYKFTGWYFDKELSNKAESGYAEKIKLRL